MPRTAGDDGARGSSDSSSFIERTAWRCHTRRAMFGQGPSIDTSRVAASADSTRCPRRTTLNSAPPLAKLLTSAIGPGASTAVRASRSGAAARIELGQSRDRRHAADAAAQQRRRARRRAGRAEFPERTLDRRDDRSRCRRTARSSASASIASRPRVALADGIDDVDRRRVRDRHPRAPAASSARAARGSLRPRVDADRPRSTRRRRESRHATSARPSSQRRLRSRGRTAPSPSTKPSRAASNGANRRENARSATSPRSDRAPCRTARRSRRRRRSSARVARPSRIRSTALTTAARPDASLWLTVTFGPRKRCSSPARLAASIGDGAVEEQRGRTRWSVAEQRVEKLLGRSATGASTCRGPRRC